MRDGMGGNPPSSQNSSFYGDVTGEREGRRVCVRVCVCVLVGGGGGRKPEGLSQEGRGCAVIKSLRGAMRSLVKSLSPQDTS